MEQGESSGSNPTPEIWAKLVPSVSRYSDVELRSDEMVVSSEVKRSSSEKHGWCKITRNSDMCSATMRNMSSSEILVDKTIVRSEDTVVIKCGSEIIPVPGPDEGNLSYTFEVILTKEHSKNHSQDILGSDPSLQRPKEEIAQLDSYASIKSPLFAVGGVESMVGVRGIGGLVMVGAMMKAPKMVVVLVISNRSRDCRKRARSPPVEERDDEESEPPCLQCSLGCDRAFCGAYWHAQTVNRSDSHPICHHETFKPILERTITRIPFSVHEKNRHEQDITDRCIRQVGRSLQDIISEWVTKFNNREIDRTSLPLHHAEMITAGTYTCKFYHQTHCKGKIAGMDMHAGHSTTMNNMLVKGIMYAVQPGA
ncbi:hypothetical protein RJ640_022686 [Escallonia rubra]|uniref:E3 ubiquitin-protein ligase CHFR cysteine rich domain-containing protein n=1 Tax=Escallonia rubra TaxID=112253 RepID=A0AA88UBB5_9ASTE|nr:hypothetical protein RJ640_022686 [Escallonia rubra]